MNCVDLLSSRLFTFVHGKHLIYNTCWEDPRLDRVALNLSKHDTVLVITSAGCNALDYALAGAGKVLAVDLNPRQNALLELKLAAIRGLSFEEFFALFGEGKLAHFASLYPKRVRPHLPGPAAAYWDRRCDYFTGAARRSFYFHGTTGTFAWLMNFYVDSIARTRGVIEALLSAASIEEQAEIYQRDLHRYLWHKPMRFALRRDSTMSLLGVPRPQKQQIDLSYAGGMPGFIEDCLAAVFGRLPLVDNYFWRVYLTGRYTRACCPEYLKPNNFAALKGGLVDRISTHTDSVAGFLEKTDAPVTRFVLLDHQDWLSHHAGGRELAREWAAIARRAAPGSKVIYRSAGFDSAFVDRVEFADSLGRRQRVGERLTYNRTLAADLHERDRVHTYGSFHLADLAV